VRHPEKSHSLQPIARIFYSRDVIYISFWIYAPLPQSLET